MVTKTSLSICKMLAWRIRLSPIHLYFSAQYSPVIRFILQAPPSHLSYFRSSLKVLVSALIQAETFSNCIVTFCIPLCQCYSPNFMGIIHKKTPLFPPIFRGMSKKRGHCPLFSPKKYILFFCANFLTFPHSARQIQNRRICKRRNNKNNIARQHNAKQCFQVIGAPKRKRSKQEGVQ